MLGGAGGVLGVHDLRLQVNAAPGSSEIHHKCKGCTFFSCFFPFWVIRTSKLVQNGFDARPPAAFPVVLFVSPVTVTR